MSRNGIFHAYIVRYYVAPREGRVSRNISAITGVPVAFVAPREGRVSRNAMFLSLGTILIVAPREGRVSRNVNPVTPDTMPEGRAPRGACE